MQRRLLGIRGFFDNMSHEWTMKFLEHRVADQRMLRLIQKWLKAGVSEDGQWSETNLGTPQGAVISPLLGSVYLHYVFDLWADVWRKKAATGDIIVVRYADDLVVGFQHRTDAQRFLKEFRERLAKFGLELTRSSREDQAADHLSNPVFVELRDCQLYEKPT
jgi:RNA-directed DNA polymerase